MHILHIITRLIRGGAQEVVIRTVAEQVRRGHHVSLAYGPIYGPEGSLFNEASASGAQLIEVPELVRRVSPLVDARCSRRLRDLIGRLSPDVVHTHSSKAGVLGRAAAWAEAVPCVVHTVHGLAFHDRQSWWARQGFVQAERFAARRCHHLIAVSPQMVDAFAEHDIAPRERFTVIPSAVNIERFDHVEIERDRPTQDWHGQGRSADRARDEVGSGGADSQGSGQPSTAKAALPMAAEASSNIDRIRMERASHVRPQLGIDPSSPVIGILARLDPLKGQDDLLDILPGLFQCHPNLHVLLIGDGFHRPKLEKRISRELPPPQAARMIFTGLVSQDRVTQIMPAVDLSVLPSYQEGQSLSLAESLLCGCGIVAYDAGGIASVCIDHQTGRLVPRGDRQALSHAITWMIEHPEERRRLTEQGKQHVRRMLDPAHMVAAIEQVYQNVLS